VLILAKLRLYQPRATKERLFRTGLDLTEDEFDQVYLKRNLKKKDKLSREEKQILQIQLDAIKAKAKKFRPTQRILCFEFENDFIINLLNLIFATIMKNIFKT
jgi:hypothetical protein